MQPQEHARTLTRFARLLPWLAMLLAFPAAAAEPPCPLDIATCLNMYQAMGERPWLGISAETDSLGRTHIKGTESGSPAQRCGIRAGDILETIDGHPPADWFAGKAGWKQHDDGVIAVLRGNKEKRLKMRFQPIPEDVLARRIGVHMVEGHLAHMHKPEKQDKH